MSIEVKREYQDIENNINRRNKYALITYINAIKKIEKLNKKIIKIIKNDIKSKKKNYKYNYIKKIN